MLIFPWVTVHLLSFQSPCGAPDTLSAPALQPPGPRPQRRVGRPAVHSAEA